MSTKSHYQTQFAYHGSTFNHLLGCAERLSEETYKANPGTGLGSIHDIFFHVLYWQNRWRQGVEKQEGEKQGRNVYLKPDDFKNLSNLRDGIQSEQVEWQRIIDGLGEEAFEAEQTIGGNTFPLWRILQHLVIHGMQHHSEVAALLTSHGESPGGIDFIWFNG